MERILFMALAATVCLVLIAFVIGRNMMSDREPVSVASSPSGPDARFVETRTGRVHVYDRGAGPVILLLHGSGRSVADWQEGFGVRLSKTYRVIGFDYYGHGLSDRAHGISYGHRLWTEQAIDVLDALGVETAVVVGHSVGGVIAARVAADFPDRITGAVTIGTGMALDPAQQLLLIPGVGEWIMGRTVIFGDTFSDTHERRLARGYTLEGTRAALLTYIRRQYTIDGVRLLWGVFEEIEAPVLHVSGTLDQSIPHEAAKALVVRTGGQFAAVEGVGHDVHIEAPERLAERIERFLTDSKHASDREEVLEN